MRKIQIKGDKFRPAFLNEMADVDAGKVESIDDAVEIISVSLDAVKANLAYFDYQNYSPDDVRRLRSILAEIAVYAQYAGHALVDVEKKMKKIE